MTSRGVDGVRKINSQFLGGYLGNEILLVQKWVDYYFNSLSLTCRVQPRSTKQVLGFVLMVIFTASTM